MTVIRAGLVLGLVRLVDIDTVTLGGNDRNQGGTSARPEPLNTF